MAILKFDIHGIRAEVYVGHRELREAFRSVFFRRKER